MTDTPAPRTTAYAVAGITLLAKTAHVWATPALVATRVTRYDAAISVSGHSEGARIARLLGITGTATFDDTSVPGYVFIARRSMIEGVELTVRSQEPASDGEVAP